MNLTPYHFPDNELEVPKLGLSFCPSANLDKYELIKDIYMFACNLTYRYMFDQDSVRARQEQEFSKSIKHYTMEDFRALRDLMLLLEENNDDIDPTSTNSQSVPNVTSQSPITSSITNTFSVSTKFKPKSQRFPDLAMNLFVWAFLVGVVSDINTILSNKNCYRTIAASYIPSFKAKYLAIINDGYQKGLIDQDTNDYLNNKHPREATFYSLPKVHKNPIEPPVRPIILGVGSLTENASRLIDATLMPHVTSLSSYTKDTLNLPKKIEGIVVPPTALLMTLDVESLYSSIPHE